DHLPTNADDFSMTSRHVIGDVGIVILFIWRRHQAADVAPNYLGRLKAEGFLCGRVYLLNDPPLVNGDNPFDRGFENRPQTFFRILLQTPRLKGTRSPASW